MLFLIQRHFDNMSLVFFFNFDPEVFFFGSELTILKKKNPRKKFKNNLGGRGVYQDNL